MRQAVLATLCYYDCLDYPLKAEEVFRFLVRAPLPAGRGALTSLTDNLSALDIRYTLDQLVLERVIDFDEGCYFLHSHDYLVPLRRKKAAISARKLRRARRIVWWLQWFPFVEAVFASGSLGLGNCDELSDLDVLIVARDGRIWTARLLITGWLSLWGLRRKPWHKLAPDRICLNHYITDHSLAIPFHTLYNAQTYLQLKPLLVDSPKLFADFQKQNAWLADFIYQPWQVGYDARLTIRPNWLARIFRAVGQRLWPAGLERWAKSYQVRRIEQNPLTQHLLAGQEGAGQEGAGHVIYDDRQLSFHPASPERAIMLKYRQRLTELAI